MTRMFKPAPGRRVRHENGMLFKAEGEPAPRGSYYDRLIADGDLIAVAQPGAKATHKTKPAVQPTSKGE